MFALTMTKLTITFKIGSLLGSLVIVEPHALKMSGKHILSHTNILYYMTVFMYDHIENSLSKCLVNILEE